MAKAKNPPQNAVGTTNGVLKNQLGTLKGQFGTLGGAPSKTPKNAKKWRFHRTDLVLPPFKKTIYGLSRDFAKSFAIGKVAPSRDKSIFCPSAVAAFCRMKRT